MTLGEFATIVGAAPRWVQNARGVLRVRDRYSIEDAKRLGLARVLAQATGMPLMRAYGAAAEALVAWPATREWTRENADGSVRVVVDVERYLSGFAARLSLSRNYYAERQRGRRGSRVREPIAAATAYGWDVTLLDWSLRLTPAQRLKRLDEASEFFRTVRRVEQ
jgi:hypothetical protein